MGRKRIELAPDVEATIAARTARGESAKTVHEAIGRVISLKTVERRQDELKGRTPKQPSNPHAADDVPENIPVDAPTEDLNRWIKRLEAGARKAELDGNLAALASIAAKVTALMALRHKSQPLPKADPNESPDMKALAVEGRERLKKLAHGLFAPQ